MRKAYAIKSVMGIVSKYPIVSKKTGLEYEVTIKPYCEDIEGFDNGSVVQLRK